jgi:hypothetical protein
MLKAITTYIKTVLMTLCSMVCLAQANDQQIKGSLVVSLLFMLVLAWRNQAVKKAAKDIKEKEASESAILDRYLGKHPTQ